ncbi:M16 family metallopeptidase, partial [Brevibacterium paucivorans]
LVKPTEQQVLLTGVQGLHLGHPDRFTLAVLQMLLGGGMSSRLFQSIREDRGLAYSVHCAGSQFSDIGDFGIYAGCAPEDTARGFASSHPGTNRAEAMRPMVL